MLRLSASPFASPFFMQFVLPQHVGYHAVPYHNTNLWSGGKV
jgi:hypothetical protein